MDTHLRRGAHPYLQGLSPIFPYLLCKAVLSASFVNLRAHILPYHRARARGGSRWEFHVHYYSGWGELPEHPSLGAQFNWGGNPKENPDKNPGQKPDEKPLKKLNLNLRSYPVQTFSHLCSISYDLCQDYLQDFSQDFFSQLNQAPGRAVNSHSGNFFIRSPIADWVRPATHNNILGLCWLPCSQIGERRLFMRKQAS